MTPTQKGQETRDRILDIAVRGASVGGLEGLSIGGLAREAAMSKSGIFAHFGSKEDLQIAVMEAARADFIDTVLRPAVEAPRGEPRLGALFEAWLDWEAGERYPGGCPIVVAAIEFEDRPGPVRDVVARILAESLWVLERAVGLGVEEKHFRPEVDPAQVAFELHGVLMSYNLQHRLLGRDDARERARAAFRAILSGCR
jgi:AcrR family transcriptional regulator